MSSSWTSSTDRKFFAGLKPQLRAAINADVEARLDPSLPWPTNSYLEMVREHVAN